MHCSTVQQRKIYTDCPEFWKTLKTYEYKHTHPYTFVLPGVNVTWVYPSRQVLSPVEKRQFLIHNSVMEIKQKNNSF